MSQKGWIGVDLDGTLAQYGGWRGAGNIGLPVEAMLSRVKVWLSAGRDVRVFTARASEGAKRSVEYRFFFAAWVEWCEFNGLPFTLPLTAEKDMSMIELWDDRVVAVEANTGKQLSPSRIEV